MQELEKILEEMDIKIAGSMGKKREGLLEARDIIRKQINAGWIPVEEQLPEDGGQVLVSMYDRVTWVTIGIYNPCRKMWEVNQYITDLGIDVKAWMPLPEPYYPERSMK